MNKKFNNALVDEKTGRIRRFRTGLETLTGEILPDLGWHAVQGVKMFALWAMGGAPALAGGIAVAGLAWHRYRQGLARSAATRADPQEGRVFDMFGALPRTWLEYHLGGRHPGFAEDYARMARTAGLKSPPRLILLTPRSDETVADGLVIGSSGADGKDAAVLLGQQIVDTLTTDELRARVAGQFARLRLDHARAGMMGSARRLFNVVTGVGLAVLAFALDKESFPMLGGLGTVGVMTVIGFGGSFAGAAMTGLRQRAEQAQSDRGAVLITGDADAVKSGLSRLKVEQPGAAADFAPTGRARSLRGRFTAWIESKESQSVAEISPLGRVLTLAGVFPRPFSARLRAIEEFRLQHQAFCNAQRLRLSPAFSNTATPANSNAARAAVSAPRLPR